MRVGGELRRRGDLLDLVVQLPVQLQDKHGGGAPAPGVFVEPGRPVQPQGRPAGDVLPGVAHPGGGPHHDRQLKALREFQGLGHHVLGLPGAGRVQHRHLGEHGEEAAVLLGLGAVGAGVVGGDHHQAAFDPQVGGAHKGVRGDVEPHLLHGDRRAPAAHGVGQGHFKGHLLVHRPLGVELGPGLFGEGDHRRPKSPRPGCRGRRRPG